MPPQRAELTATTDDAAHSTGAHSSASHDTAHHILKVNFRRQHIWWTWELIAVRDDGTHPAVLTRGACLRKKTAWSAVHSWQRIYLRRLGRY